ncbi:MAG: ACP S-malonyltransferase [Pseudomonadota bacterium]
MTRKTAMVVCPGRGVYNAPELGYLARLHSDKRGLIETFDAERNAQGQDNLTNLDGAPRYSVSKYTRGDNASALIYACSYADFLDISQDKFEIVAVTGNSMGWYTALACAGALSDTDGFKVVNTMGAIMQEALIGGQLIYPFVDETWREIDGERDRLLAMTEKIENLYVSIRLGGMLVLAGDDAALAEAERRLPPTGRFPMRLGNHAAFHTELQTPTAERGRAALPVSLFHPPKTPLIDGRGHVWLPKATPLQDLWDYTLEHQVTETYDFTKAVTAGLHEFAPEAVILLGPGATLGGATAQTMIADGWRGLTSKADFTALQNKAPYILSMGLPDQRDLVT